MEGWCWRGRDGVRRRCVVQLAALGVAGPVLGIVVVLALLFLALFVAFVFLDLLAETVYFIAEA